MKIQPISQKMVDTVIVTVLGVLFALGAGLFVLLVALLIGQANDSSPPDWKKTCVENTTTYIPVMVGTITVLSPIDTCVRYDMVCKAGAAYTGPVACQGTKPDLPSE